MRLPLRDNRRFSVPRAITLLVFSLFALAAWAQPTLLSSTEAVFHHPESAVYDARHKCIYISNLDKDTPMDALHTDAISRVLPDGTVTDVRFIEGLSSPTGLAMHNGLLYAVERDGVAEIDPERKRILRRFPIKDAGFLNDIAIDAPDGTMYVSETDSAGRIFRIQNGIAEIWMQDALLGQTNGLLVHGNSLIAGVNADNYLKSIDLKTRVIHNIVNFGPGNIDGIQATTQGWLVSHFLGNLYAVDTAQHFRELLYTREQDIFIADFAYIPEMQLLVVPSLRTHKVYLYRYVPQPFPENDSNGPGALPTGPPMITPRESKPKTERTRKNRPNPSSQSLRPSSAQSWVDSLDNYARNKFLPAKKYNWTWQQAAFLRSMTAQYDLNVGPDRSIYLDYVRTAMDKSMHAAYAGHNPNGVASGFGLAWLARVTGEAKYRDAAIRLYQKYLEIPRAANGGVTHLRGYRELWDDTIFMVGIYLLEMYLLTNDEMYLDELLLQVEAHREKLQVAEWGLWVHGWDGDDKDHCRLCSQQGWSKNAGKRSTEIWGRGNGWVVVTLTQVVESTPKTHPQWPRFAGYLKEMLAHLPELQDTATGHWFQLPVYPHEPGNYIESSCTAMFGYGIAGGLRMGIVEGEAYQRSVERAYRGLREFSMEPKSGGYLMTKNICTGTCIGDKDYYFKRGAGREKSFGVGMFLLFGRGVGRK